MDRYSIILTSPRSPKSICLAYTHRPAHYLIVVLIALQLMMAPFFWKITKNYLIAQQYESLVKQHQALKQNEKNLRENLQYVHETLKKLHVSDKRLNRALGVEIQRENTLLGEENLFAKQITIENIVLGNRMLVEKLKIQEKVLLEIYSDLDHKKESNLNATEIAQKLNAIFKRSGNNAFLKITESKDTGEWIGQINRTELFRISAEDAAPYSLAPDLLAQKWANAINYELQLTKRSANPLKQKIMSNIPVEEKLALEIAALTTSVSERKEKLDGLRAKTLEFSRHFARTPSMLPVDFPIASPFGMRIHPLTKTALFHKGLDFAAYYGSPVYATADGTVTVAGPYRGYGNTVKIYHGWGITTLYAHNSQVMVKPGDWIHKGQLIARSGASGFVEGAHVHYEVLRGGVAINPLPYLDLNILSASTTWTE